MIIMIPKYYRDVQVTNGWERMKEFEFMFHDGTKLSGFGEDAVKAMMDAVANAPVTFDRRLDNFLISVTQVSGPATEQDFEMAPAAVKAMNRRFLEPGDMEHLWDLIDEMSWEQFVEFHGSIRSLIIDGMESWEKDQESEDTENPDA